MCGYIIPYNHVMPCIVMIMPQPACMHCMQRCVQAVIRCACKTCHQQVRHLVPQDDIRGWQLGWQYIDAGSYRTLDPDGAVLVSGSSGDLQHHCCAQPCMRQAAGPACQDMLPFGALLQNAAMAWLCQLM